MKNLLARSQGRIAETRLHLQSVHGLAPDGQYGRSLSERALVTEACFLKLFIALEEFLEASFVHYLVGRMSTARWRPSKYAKPPTSDHAHKMLLGQQRFVDWSTPDTVVKYAELYFLDGEPFKTPLSGAATQLQDMKTVRNSTAHMSTTTQAKLEGLYVRWSGTPKYGISAYEMLMEPKAGGGGTFYFESEQYVTAIIANIANRT